MGRKSRCVDLADSATASHRYLRIEERELEAFSLGSVSYPPVQPAAFSCCVRRAAIGATMERKRAGLACVASSLRWALKKSAGQPSYWSPQ